MEIEENHYSQTWRMSPDLLGIVNQEGVFFETNPAWQSVLGWSKPEIINMVFTDFLHPDDIEKTLGVFHGLKEGQPALHFENRYRHKDGSYRWLSWVAVPEGDVFVCSARDVTNDKATVRALQSSEDEALLREQFVAILGHDLRNPLAGIASATRIAGREPHSEKVTAMYASIQSGVNRMARLIDDTMDLARARLGGGIPIDLETVPSLKDGFQRVIDEIGMAHPDRPIEYIYDCRGPIICDPARLDQLLSNLVANAVTHGSDEAPIFVRAENRKSEFILSVANSGKPIPESQLADLFKPFERSGDSESLQGLGLGLFIAQEIANAHHGSIDVASDEKETRFTLQLPMRSERHI